MVRFFEKNWMVSGAISLTLALILYFSGDINNYLELILFFLLSGFLSFAFVRRKKPLRVLFPLIISISFLFFILDLTLLNNMISLFGILLASLLHLIYILKRKKKVWKGKDNQETHKTEILKIAKEKEKEKKLDESAKGKKEESENEKIIIEDKSEEKWDVEEEEVEELEEGWDNGEDAYTRFKEKKQKGLLITEEEKDNGEYITYGDDDFVYMGDKKHSTFSPLSKSQGELEKKNEKADLKKEVGEILDDAEENKKNDTSLSFETNLN